MARRSFRRKRTTRRPKRSFKRKAMGRRRTGRRRVSKKRSGNGKRIHHQAKLFKFTVTKTIQFNPASPAAVSNIDVDATSTFPFAGAVLFKLGDIPACYQAAFQEIFEEIKLSGVKVEWIPQSQGTSLYYSSVTVPSTPPSVNGFTSGVAIPNPMNWIIDRDVTVNAGAVSYDAETYTMLEERAGHHTWSDRKYHSTFFKPTIFRELAYSNPSGTAFATVMKPNAKAGWLSCHDVDDATAGAAFSVNQLGFKYSVRSPSAGLPTLSDGIVQFRHLGIFKFTYYVACRKQVGCTAEDPEILALFPNLSKATDEEEAHLAECDCDV